MKIMRIYQNIKKKNLLLNKNYIMYNFIKNEKGRKLTKSRKLTNGSEFFYRILKGWMMISSSIPLAMYRIFLNRW